jgi:glycosidase
MTIPGIPSVYYGSEWGTAGERTRQSDAALRPALTLEQANTFPHPDLAAAIQRLTQIRRSSPALLHGDYQELKVAAEQLAFLRSTPEQQMVVMVNAASQPVPLDLRLPAAQGWLVDWLNPGASFRIQDHHALVESLPNWGRILEIKPG